jgi:hypothetical protein
MKCNHKSLKNLLFIYIVMIVQQLICDVCKIVLLEKDSKYLTEEKFPITEEEAKMIDKDHRGHQCHIEVVEKMP